MAEFVMKDLVEKAGISAQFEIVSAATSTEASACAAASFFVQMNRQKPSQQPSRKKSSALPSTGSHRLLHRTISHRWMFCLGQVPMQASQAMHSPLRRLVSSSFRHTGHCCLQALQPGMQPSLCRCSRANGSTGSRANTAPMGQRN